MCVAGPRLWIRRSVAKPLPPPTRNPPSPFLPFCATQTPPASLTPLPAPLALRHPPTGHSCRTRRGWLVCVSGPAGRRRLLRPNSPLPHRPPLACVVHPAGRPPPRLHCLSVPSRPGPANYALRNRLLVYASELQRRPRRPRAVFWARMSRRGACRRGSSSRPTRRGSVWRRAGVTRTSQSGREGTVPTCADILDAANEYVCCRVLCLGLGSAPTHEGLDASFIKGKCGYFPSVWPTWPCKQNTRKTQQLTTDAI